MHGNLGSRSTFTAVSTVLTLVLAPSLASAGAPPHKALRTARITAHDAPSAPCNKPPVEFVAGSETSTFSLAACDGGAVSASLDKLSALTRPIGSPKPKEADAAPAKAPEATPAKGAEASVAATTAATAASAAPAHKIDARVADRLERVVEHFRKADEPVKIVLVTGMGKGRSPGSFHASGRAIDFRIEGVDNEEVATFCKTLPDTGCGFYPNSNFVHIDARDAGAGHVAWIDVSKPGEAPKYVSSWEKPEEAARREEAAKREGTAKREDAARREETKTEEAAKHEEAAKVAKNTEGPHLPSLPAAAQYAPLESPAAAAPATPAPAGPTATTKHPHHHRHHKVAPSPDHSI